MFGKIGWRVRYSPIDVEIWIEHIAVGRLQIVVTADPTVAGEGSAALRLPPPEVIYQTRRIAA